jgi:hypothetical protein
VYLVNNKIITYKADNTSTAEKTDTWVSVTCTTFIIITIFQHDEHMTNYTSIFHTMIWSPLLLPLTMQQRSKKTKITFGIRVLHLWTPFINKGHGQWYITICFPVPLVNTRFAPQRLPVLHIFKMANKPISLRLLWTNSLKS